MTVLLTGGSGFIGSNVLEALSGRYRILAPRSRELDLADDGAVRAFFKANRVEAVIHSAVRPGHRNAADPSRQLYLNARMFFNLVSNLSGVERFILLGSGSEYDLRRDLVKVREEDFGGGLPLDDGGFSKYIASSFIDLNPGKMVNLRLFGVFGRHEDYAIRFISNAICKALFGLPITLRQNRRFDYLYIDDLMPVLEHALENRMAHTAYNVTPDRSVELLEIARMVRARSGRELPIRVAQPGLGAEYSGENARLRGEIPSLRFTALEEAIDRLYGWYERHLDSIDREQLLVDK